MLTFALQYTSTPVSRIEGNNSGYTFNWCDNENIWIKYDNSADGDGKPVITIGDRAVTEIKRQMILQAYVHTGWAKEKDKTKKKHLWLAWHEGFGLNNEKISADVKKAVMDKIRDRVKDWSNKFRAGCFLSQSQWHCMAEEIEKGGGEDEQQEAANENKQVKFAQWAYDAASDMNEFTGKLDPAIMVSLCPKHFLASLEESLKDNPFTLDELMCMKDMWEGLEDRRRQAEAL